jgi:hypothetical protein
LSGQRKIYLAVYWVPRARRGEKRGGKKEWYSERGRRSDDVCEHVIDVSTTWEWGLGCARKIDEYEECKRSISSTMAVP